VVEIKSSVSRYRLTIFTSNHQLLQNLMQLFHSRPGTFHQATLKITHKNVEMPISINLLKSRNYFTYIPKYYMVLALRLYVLNGSQNNQRLLPYTTLADKFCMTVVESVYCAVRIEFLCKTDTFSLHRLSTYI
jgi:hypothetical protein